MPSIAELPLTISIDQFFRAPESPGGGLLITHTKVSYLWYVPKIRISNKFPGNGDATSPGITWPRLFKF